MSSRPIRQNIIITIFVFGCGFLVGCGAPRGRLADQRYQLMRENANKLAVGGRISRVSWSEDGQSLYFSRNKVHCRFDLAREVLTENVEDPNRDSSDKAKRPHPGRGKQRSTEPSPDEKWLAQCENWNVIIKKNIEKKNESTEEQGNSNSEKSDKKTKRKNRKARKKKQKKPKTIQVTTDGDRKLRYGTASWVYGEELDQNEAMWWSGDSRMLAFYEFDDRQVRDFYLTGDLTEVRTRLLQEGYPKAGEPNPVVGLKVYHFRKKRLVSIDCGDDPNQYIYNVRFRPDGSELLFNRTNRLQSRLELVAAHVKTGKGRVVVREEQKTWQENNPTMRFLSDGERFIWETEKTGWAQYELRHIDGTKICTLTRGEYPVSGIVHIDESGGWLYYSAYDDTRAITQQLHKVRLDGASQTLLTNSSFHHTNFNLSPCGKWFVAQYEAIDTSPTTVLYDTDGNLVATLAESDTSKSKELGIIPPELFTYKADDGVTDLYGILYKPSNFKSGRKYPLIIDVYGGPGVRPRIFNLYRTVRSETEYGFLIAMMDNRGTPSRGKKFEGATYQKLGQVDIQDQVAGVKYLCRRSYIDSTRVGIVGHSYGGYMSALAILKYPQVFAAAVARAAVTDWHNYDTIYTERYMRTPQQNPEGYKNSSCMTYARQLQGKLMIMHGMVDDNVHPNNAWQLIDALDKAKKPYESRFFPKNGHGFGGRETQWSFFRRHLLDKK